MIAAPLARAGMRQPWTFGQTCFALACARLLKSEQASKGRQAELTIIKHPPTQKPARHDTGPQWTQKKRGQCKPPRLCIASGLTAPDPRRAAPIAVCARR